MGAPGHRDPLKARTVKPGGAWRRPVEPDAVSQRLTVLVHEIAGLLDGSMRQVSLVLRDLEEAKGVRQGDDEQAERLRVVHTAMGKMAEALRHASGGAPSASLQGSCGLSLADAVRYAAGIMEPAAHERGITIEVELADRLSQLPPGHVYTVVLNGVRNALEAIVAAGPRKVLVPGKVVVHGCVEARPSGEWVVIEVRDTGIGPPKLGSGRAAMVFDPRFSTKPGGLGVGLSLSRQIVESLGGFIDLLAREGGGAVLRTSFPANAPAGEPAGPIG